MLNLAGEIAIAQGRLRQAIEQSSGKKNEPLEAQDQVERLSLELQETIMKVRMVPVGPTFHQYIRTVRDVAKVPVRQPNCVWRVKISRSMLASVEHLKDPLTHMIRNALDAWHRPAKGRKSAR